MMTNKLDGLSMDIEKQNLDKLKEVFPDCFHEGKLDFDKLQSLCGEYIDNDYEKYSFTWKGKAECLKLAQKRSTGTLRPCREESVDFDHTKNLYIEGDNLEVLKLLQTAYYNSVKMIYIDPPYNTGNDFVYEDDFEDSIRKYKEITGQTTKSNPETMGHYHTNWLNMMYPRLRLAANLLRDDGVIFISIDDNEVHNLRKICDEVFGEENFVCQFIWEKVFAPKNDAKYVSNSHDYILMYAKNIVDFQIGKLERTEEANSRYKNPDNDPRGLWTSGDLSVKTYNANADYEIVTPSGKRVNPPHGACWRVSKEKFNELVNDNRIWFGENGDNVPRLKRFLSEIQEGMTPTSILFYKDVGHNQESRQELKKLFDDRGYFDGPKPLRLLKRLFQMANSQSDDIIMDFFSGSATTAHAVMQLNAEDGGNRRFIMVQLPELCGEKTEAYKAGYANICEIGKERIRRAGRKVVSEKWAVIRKEEMAKCGCKELSRADCMAEINGSSQANIFDSEETAQGGTVCAFGSDEEGGSLHSVQYSGGAGSELDQGISAISSHSEGFQGGAGDATAAMRSGGIPCPYGYFGSDGTVTGSGEDAECPYKNTHHCPLITNHCPDVGFKVFKLDTSNLTTWDNTPIPEDQLELFYERMNEMIDSVKPDRTDMDVVYEVMLKLGVPLDIPVTDMEVNGKTVYVVDDCLLLICLADNITAEDMEAMAEYAPAKIICAEASFADDSALSNAHYILRDRSIELKLV